MHNRETLIDGHDYMRGSPVYVTSVYGKRYFTTFGMKLSEGDVIALLSPGDKYVIPDYVPPPHPAPNPDHVALARYYADLERWTGLKVF